MKVDVTYYPRQQLWSVRRDGVLVGMYTMEKQARRHARELNDRDPGVLQGKLNDALRAFRLNREHRLALEEEVDAYRSALRSLAEAVGESHGRRSESHLSRQDKGRLVRVALDRAWVLLHHYRKDP